MLFFFSPALTLKSFPSLHLTNHKGQYFHAWNEVIFLLYAFMIFTQQLELEKIVIRAPFQHSIR